MEIRVRWRGWGRSWGCRRRGGGDGAGVGGCSSQGRVSTAADGIALHQNCFKKNYDIPPTLYTHAQNNPGSPWQPAPWPSLAPEEGGSLLSFWHLRQLVPVLAQPQPSWAEGPGRLRPAPSSPKISGFLEQRVSRRCTAPWESSASRNPASPADAPADGWV